MWGNEGLVVAFIKKTQGYVCYLSVNSRKEKWNKENIL